MNHRGTAAVFALVAAFGIAACGGDGGGSGAGPTTTTAAAPASTTTTAAAVALELTPTGLGPLQLGMSTADASATGLIGPTQPGCELGGPGVLGATLTGAVHGSVTFTSDRLSAIVVTTGASTHEGIHEGSTLDEVNAAYAAGGFAASTNTDTVDVFGVKVVQVTLGGAPAYGMTVDPPANTVIDLWVPSVQFCD